MTVYTLQPVGATGWANRSQSVYALLGWYVETYSRHCVLLYVPGLELLVIS